MRLSDVIACGDEVLYAAVKTNDGETLSVYEMDRSGTLTPIYTADYSADESGYSISNVQLHDDGVITYSLFCLVRNSDTGSSGIRRSSVAWIDGVEHRIPGAEMMVYVDSSTAWYLQGKDMLVWDMATGTSVNLCSSQGDPILLDGIDPAVQSLLGVDQSGRYLIYSATTYENDILRYIEEYALYAVSLEDGSNYRLYNLGKMEPVFCVQ